MKKSMSYILFAMILIFGIGLTSGGTQHTQPSKEQVQRFDTLKVNIEDFPAEGFILDIGGGGEGIIGQLKTTRCIAIDINKRELEEAPPGPLKIVMDGRDLKFLDSTFNTVTIFFTFMYIPGEDHDKVMREAYRVLTSGGKLLIWDVIFPAKTDKNKSMGIFPLEISLPDKNIRTGYGVNWPEKGRGGQDFIRSAKTAGFAVINFREQQNWFFLELEKQ